MNEKIEAKYKKVTNYINSIKKWPLWYLLSIKKINY